MGLFNLFKKTPPFVDEYFGELEYIISKDPSKSFYSGKGIFPPTGNEIDYVIITDQSGPTAAQKQFYEDVQRKYPAYVEKVKPLMEEELKNWQEGIVIKDFDSEFTLFHITIPRLDSKPVTWEISFKSIHDEAHDFNVDFTDDTPNGVMIDG